MDVLKTFIITITMWSILNEHDITTHSNAIVRIAPYVSVILPNSTTNTGGVSGGGDFVVKTQEDRILNQHDVTTHSIVIVHIMVIPQKTTVVFVVKWLVRLVMHCHGR